MGISEVTDFLNDLQEAATAIRSQLDMVKESIEAINGMSSFSGKAAKEAKQYFGALHLTILESFRGLFDDLEENLQQHIETFGSNVDASESAMIQSNYLKDVKEDINEGFDDLKKQDEIISETIQKISDISSAVAPSFTDVSNGKKESVKFVKELDGDLSAFNGKGDESNTKDLLHQIEEAMNRAKTNDGEARFTDYTGSSENIGLMALKNYNEGKQREVEIEKAKEAKDDAIRELNKPSQSILNKAYTELKNGEIDSDKYYTILSVLKKIKGELNEKEINEEVPQGVIEFLNDHKAEISAELGINIFGVLVQWTGKGMMKIGDFTKKLKDLSDSLIKNGRKIVTLGKVVGPAFAGVAAVYGTYDDLANKNKTVGEAVTHNVTSLGVGIGVGTLGTIGTAALLGTTPIGWALLGGGCFRVWCNMDIQLFLR